MANIQDRMEDDFIDMMVSEMLNRYKMRVVDIRKEIKRELAIMDDRYRFHLQRVKKINKVKQYKRLG